MTIRVAIIGAGVIADEHARCLRAAGDRVRLVAVADVAADRLKEFRDRHDIPAGYADPTSLLAAERPDLVHVCTPPGTHADLGVRCLEAGAWVLCEKPLCGSLAELDRIEAAQRATGRWCSSVAQWRFGSAAQHLKRLIGEGVTGRPLLALCETTWYRDALYYSAPWRGRWDTELGGATTSQGIHAIDLFLWLFGAWREVTATLGTVDHEIAVEDVSLAGVVFENGALGGVVNSTVSPHEETRLRFDFQRATFEVACLYSYGNSDWRCTEAPSSEGVASTWAAIDSDVRGVHAAQIRAMLDAFESGRRPPASAGEVRPTIEFVSSLYKSAVTGERVRRGSIRTGDPFYEHLAGTLARA